MSERREKRLPSAIAALATACGLACVTINVYFPEAAVRNLSEQIEDQVQERAEDLGSPEASGAGEATSPEESAEPADGARRLAILLQASDVPRAEVSSPAIERIIESRAQRLGELNRFKSAEVLGEGNDGLVALRTLEPLSELRERALAQRLVKEENADRERLYQEIATIKKVDRSQLPRIRETYAETLRSKARPGDWIQLPNGDWVRKKAS